MKINLEKKILNIKGKEIKKTDPETRKPLKEALTIRDYLLTVLGQKFAIKNRKETFWTQDLGIKFSDDKNKEVEVSQDKIDFLARVVEDNKYKMMSPTGEKETELFFPFEIGQLLIALGKSEE